MKNSLVTWFNNVSITKKLYFVVSIMAILIAVELLMLVFTIGTLSSTRAYVGGEGLWSKAEKDAVYSLRKYYVTHNENEYQDFLDFIRVPLGDRKARIELEKEVSDPIVVYQGFIQGKNNSSDIEGMMKLFKRFRHIEYIDRAISIWKEADDNITKLKIRGDELHEQIFFNRTEAGSDNTLLEIDALNKKLTVLEDQFSSTLGEGSRWLEGLILKILFFIALSVELTGLLLTFSISIGISRGINDIVMVSEKIARADFSERAKAVSYDEIGMLARSFNKMADDLEQKIDERIRAEGKLLDQAQQLAEAQEMAHIGNWEWDIIANTLTWSEELYRIHGLDPKTAKIDYDLVYKMIHVADRDNAIKTITESKETGRSFSFYYRIVLPDRSIKLLHARGEVTVNEKNETIKLFGTDQDVTERNHEENMENLAVAATKSYNSVIIANSDGIIEWVNEGFTKLTGFTLEEVKNTHGELLRKGEDTGLSIKTHFHEEVMREKRPVTYESKNYTRTGAEYWVITTLTPVLGKSGEVERIIAIDSDITLRKRAEEDLLDANKIAEQSLRKGKKALNELMKAKIELEGSVKIKEQFLANMSHEIRTPMNAIIGFTDLIRKTQIDDEQKQYIEAIRISGENLLVIINDILDFSRMQSGKIAIERIGFRLSQVMSTFIELLLPKSVEKNINLSSTVDKNIPDRLIGDPTRLNQILLNLVGNAIKFTERGEVRTNVRLVSEDDVTLILEFSITDTGIGIPKKKLQTIFDSFTQATSDTTRKYGGSGLGLSIVKQLVEMQGGNVFAKSTVGQGSVFTFTLPFRKNTEVATDEEGLVMDEEITCAIDGLNILLVEDNSLNQVLARKVLTDAKCNVEIADNGLIAVEKMKAKDFDLVLMDIQLPEMDGYEATRFIRKQLTSPKCDTPIIAVTAHAMSDEEEKCHKAGMNGYLSKPFNQKALFNKIASVVNADHRSVKVKNARKNNNLPKKKHIDLRYLKEMANGSNEFMAEMLSLFMTQTPIALRALKESLRKSDWTTLRSVAHKMKPSMTFMGLKEMELLIREVEESAEKKENIEKLPGWIEHLSTTCDHVFKELEEEIKNFT